MRGMSLSGAWKGSQAIAVANFGGRAEGFGVVDSSKFASLIPSNA